MGVTVGDTVGPVGLKDGERVGGVVVGRVVGGVVFLQEVSEKQDCPSVACSFVVG